MLVSLNQRSDQTNVCVYEELYESGYSPISHQLLTRLKLAIFCERNTCLFQVIFELGQ